MAELLVWIEGSAVGVFVRESLYGFPMLVGIHILGLILSVGMLLWVDLRMLGLCLTASRLSAVYRTLAPWLVAGFVVMFASGAALFAGFASSAVDNLFFRVKLLAIAIAGVNAVLFHVAAGGLDAAADSAARPPSRIRVAGALSLALWAGVILCGRMMSYTLF